MKKVTGTKGSEACGQPAGRNRAAETPGKIWGNHGTAVQLSVKFPKRSGAPDHKGAGTGRLCEPGVLRLRQCSGTCMMRVLEEADEDTPRNGPHRQTLLPGAPDGAFTGDIKVRTRTADTDGMDKNLFIPLIDDHSRYIVQSEFYDNPRQEIVEDTFHKAVLKAGKFDCVLDNGVQYTSAILEKPVQSWGYVSSMQKPGVPAKGKIENFTRK